jgi:hypothetical protein
VLSAHGVNAAYGGALGVASDRQAGAKVRQLSGRVTSIEERLDQLEVSSGTRVLGTSLRLLAKEAEAEMSSLSSSVEVDDAMRLLGMSAG